MGDANEGSLIVIGDGANMNARTALAQKLAKRGFSNIEPMTCKDLYQAAKAIQDAAGIERFQALLAFVSKCMTGCEKSELEKAVRARLTGPRQGQAKFGDLFPVTDELIRTGSDDAMLAFLRAMQERTGAHLYRREMFYAMRSALQIKSTHRRESLPDEAWKVQNRIRHAGRNFARRSIGSTLLVKGLEFDHAVIVHAANMTRKDWYVALTRASKSARVISPTDRFTPPR
jgi:DNA helicase-2/ATP-dependent DNA helicase PcrA